MKPQAPRHLGAFTLIELLIVVAIIAILAAIAVPNFLEAQTRSKVARAKTDMRTISLGIESYVVDSNNLPLSPVDYPFRNPGPNGGVVPAGYKHMILASLSTPIAYITSFPADPFGGDIQQVGGEDTRRYYDYRRTFMTGTPIGGQTMYEYILATSGNLDTSRLPAIFAAEKPNAWLLYSNGPDKWSNVNRGTDQDDNSVPRFGSRLGTWPYYDASNGTLSVGDIMRSSIGDEASMSSR